MRHGRDMCSWDNVNMKMAATALPPHDLKQVDSCHNDDKPTSKAFLHQRDRIKFESKKFKK